jgi:hypothetical protein
LVYLEPVIESLSVPVFCPFSLDHSQIQQLVILSCELE